VQTTIFFTVDTENSMGCAWSDPTLTPVSSDRRIFCKVNGRDNGVGWMCKELQRRGLRASFFGEMFASLLFGECDTRYWVDFLLKNGQDVQLHTHLNYYFYAEHRGLCRPLSSRLQRTDDLAGVPEPERRALLDLACDIFTRATGRRPVAFRAGSWRGTRGLLADLHEAGIVIDSSFNPSLQGRGSFDGEELGVNSIQRIEGVWEVPVTVARQSLPDPATPNGFKALDPASMSVWELRRVLDHAFESGLEHVVAVFHSFSAVKPGDPQYSRLRPDRIVQRRFTLFLDYVANNPARFRVSTFGDLAARVADVHRAPEGLIADLGVLRPLARKIVQAINSLYWV
jgi:hypothetical protein